MSRWNLNWGVKNNDLKLKFRTDPGLPARIIPLTALENGHYDAGEDAAFNPVEVAVPEPSGTVQISANGMADVKNYASADVNVPNSYDVSDEGKVVQNGELVGQTDKSINSNGTVDTTINNQVIVNVPNSYDISDEGKVVNNGALAAQTARTVDTNGTYDTTMNDSVTVDIHEPEPGTMVEFRDYDGTLLHAYTPAEVQLMTELPPLPVHEKLTFVRWNWTLTQLKEENCPIIVGAQMRPSDGHTKILIELEAEISSPISLSVKPPAGKSITIDWGDNTDPVIVSSNATVTHDFVITTYPASVWLDFYCDESTIYSIPTINSQLYRARVTKIYFSDLASFSVVSNYFSLEEVVLPNEITSFPNNSFQSCLKLKYITIPDRVSSFGNGCFASCVSLELISIPKSVTDLNSDSLFNGCSKLAFVAIPNGAITINPQIFRSCMLIKNISLPSSLRSIGNFAFYYASTLLFINIPDGVTTLGNSVFQDCWNLRYVHLPNSITSFGATVFRDTKSITCYDFTDWSISDLDSCTFGANIFQNLANDTKILFKYKSVADHAATVTNLLTFASYFDYEEDDT